MKRYRLTPMAEGDLAEIWRYFEETWGAAQADYLRDIEAALERYSQNPSLAVKSDDIRPGYWRFRVKSHIVFFKRDGEWIDVVRILHGAMDYPRHL